MLIYCAGPFFNSIQKAWAFEIALGLEEEGFEVCAPVREMFKEGSTLDAEAIFQRNVVWMRKSDYILVQLDYPLMPEEEILVMPEGKPINLPDSGTVWEMGFCFALGKPIIGYTYGDVEKINLMLTKSLMGIVLMESFYSVFDKGIVKLDKLQEFKGKEL